MEFASRFGSPVIRPRSFSYREDNRWFILTTLMLLCHLFLVTILPNIPIVMKHILIAQKGDEMTLLLRSLVSNMVYFVQTEMTYPEKDYR